MQCQFIKFNVLDVLTKNCNMIRRFKLGLHIYTHIYIYINYVCVNQCVNEGFTECLRLS